MSHLILAVFVVHREGVNLGSEHPYSTHRDLLLLHLLLTNVLIVSRFGQKRLLNVNLNIKRR